MRVFRVEVPFVVTVSGIFRTQIEESDILRRFQVNNIESVDPDLLDDYVRSEAAHRAYDQPQDRLVQALRLKSNIEVFEDQVEVIPE